MEEYEITFWRNKLEKVKKQLEINNFEVYIADNAEEAKSIFFEKIFAVEKPLSVGWGDSMTLHKTLILEELRNNKEINFIDTFDKSLDWKDQIKKRKEALTSDLFLTGSNAVTEKGQLVNLDMVGNRVAAITFGPRKVALFIGRNKIVPNLDEAVSRIKNLAAPLNAARHPNMVTPCKKTSACMDCTSPQRLCNTWVITEKSFPKGRIKIILINEDLGL
jgi:L-lactate utilization protein LutB